MHFIRIICYIIVQRPILFHILDSLHAISIDRDALFFQSPIRIRIAAFHSVKISLRHHGFSRTSNVSAEQDRTGDKPELKWVHFSWKLENHRFPHVNFREQRVIWLMCNLLPRWMISFHRKYFLKYNTVSETYATQLFLF